MLDGRMHGDLVDKQQIQKKDAQAKSDYQFFYDCCHSALPNPDLRPGQAVWVKLNGDKEWRTPAKVIGMCNEPPSYMVKTGDGAVLRHNRRHLQALSEAADPQDLQPQPEDPLLQLPNRPPSVAGPGHRDHGSALGLKDPPTAQSPLQSSPHHGNIEVMSRGREVRVHLRFTDICHSPSHGFRF